MHNYENIFLLFLSNISGTCFGNQFSDIEKVKLYETINVIDIHLTKMYKNKKLLYIFYGTKFLINIWFSSTTLIKYYNIYVY